MPTEQTAAPGWNGLSRPSYFSITFSLLKSKRRVPQFPITVRPTDGDVTIARTIARNTTPQAEDVAEFLTWGADEHVLCALAAGWWVWARSKSPEARLASDHVLLTTVVVIEALGAEAARAGAGIPASRRRRRRTGAGCARLLLGARVLGDTRRLSVAGLAAAIAACDLVVSNDSGPAHLAAALRRPLIVLRPDLPQQMGASRRAGSRHHALARLQPLQQPRRDDVPQRPMPASRSLRLAWSVARGLLAQAAGGALPRP